MALFDKFRGKQVTCVQCGTALKETDAKVVNNRHYCPACHQKLEQAALAYIQHKVSQGKDNGKPGVISQIEQALSQVDLRYSTIHVGDQWEIVLNISGKTTSYQIKLITKTDSSGDFSLRIFNLTHFPGKRQEACRVLNRFQQTYRFLRFSLDEDNQVDVGYDFPSCITSPGPSAVEMVLRTMKIIDDIHPELMRAAWGAGKNAGPAARQQETRKCIVCNSSWNGKTELCPSCLRKSLRSLRLKAYLTGQITADGILYAGKKPDSTLRRPEGCIYCGSRDNLTGSLCGNCKRTFLPQMMRKVNESKNDPQLNRVKKDLYETIRSRHAGLTPENLALGPTPSGGAYAIKLRTGNSIYIGEFDENQVEISHSRGRSG